MYQAIQADPSLAKNSSALADIYYDKLQDLNPNVDLDFLRTKAEFAATKLAAGIESIVYTGKKLSEGQIYMIFNRVSEQQQLTEGPLDFIKGAAAKGMAKLQTVGKNLTTKVTADKLNSAWKKAGSPMDSEEVAKILTAAGVGDDIVGKVYTDLKLPAPGSAPAAGSEENPAAAQAAAGGYAEVKKAIAQLNTKDRKRMIAYLTKQLGTA
jgi:ribosomal protein L12E/L44/L45/RPP1/RPP2